MSQKKYLIFDIGTSKGRTSIADFNGESFKIELIYTFNTAPVFCTNILYCNILSIYDGLKEGIVIAFQNCKEKISSLGIDTWACDFGFIDKNGRLIADPINLRDEKRNNAGNELYEIISKEKLFYLTGESPVHFETSIFNLFVLKKYNFTELANASKFLLLPDLLNYFLTGNTFNEYTNATTTVMCNQIDKKWESKIIEEALKVPMELFCLIIQPGIKIGKIKKEVLKELDIPQVNVVSVPSHDSAAAFAGIPASRQKIVKLFITLGTWAIMAYENQKPLITREVLLSGFGNEGGADKKTLLVKETTGLWIMQKCLEKWRSEKGYDFGWDDIDSVYENAPRFLAFIDIYDPVFASLQPNMPEIIREYCRNSGQNVPQSIAEISRCFYESLVLKFKYYFIQIQRLTGNEFEIIHMVGGGIRNKRLCQWVSNCLGRPVEAGPVETTTVGNLLMQLKADGEIKDLQEGRLIAANSFRTVFYEPDLDDKSIWDAAFQDYCLLLKKFPGENNNLLVN